MKATGCHLLSRCCESIAPIAKSEASVSSRNWLSSGIKSVAFWTMAFFRESNAICCSGPQVQSTFPVSKVSGLAMDP